MPIRILALDGDGIGPEIMEATLEVVYLNQKLDLNLQISKDLIGLQSFDKNGITITPQVIENSNKWTELF